MNKLTVRQIMRNMNWLCLFTYGLTAIMSFAMCKWECGIAWTCASLMTVVLMLEERHGEQEKKEFAIILLFYRLDNWLLHDMMEKLRMKSGDKPNGKDKE